MTTKRTEESKHWINTKQEWNLPATDTNNKALPKGNGSTSRRHKARRFAITKMTPATGRKPSIVTVAEKCTKKTKNCDILTRTMLKVNYHKCELFFVQHQINKQWHRNIREHKEMKLRSGYEDCEGHHLLGIENRMIAMTARWATIPTTIWKKRNS